MPLGVYPPVELVLTTAYSFNHNVSITIYSCALHRGYLILKSSWKSNILVKCPSEKKEEKYVY